ncbi:MAG: hypothetical protein LBL66_02375 [Clostridiales bacterium]|nr:hypothetical protein [Clostridiales bacterium]
MTTQIEQTERYLRYARALDKEFGKPMMHALFRDGDIALSFIDRPARPFRVHYRGTHIGSFGELMQALKFMAYFSRKIKGLRGKVANLRGETFVFPA